ncbi:hypothetical protein GIB67_035087 [Kingdonia uniflora]|uniref:Uncharacterized protein n=1 Tax=Kingdonia uniflora TaxID=39325 RepID=A0A7J7LBL6_9MAGN|nr:hypothetical protein GIB67_035087 [Kingdonia uniflora]
MGSEGNRRVETTHRLRQRDIRQGIGGEMVLSNGVLAHEAIGCFVTHCGWNSVLEGLSFEVPLVAMPKIWDQPTNAKFVADVWGVGIRAKANDKGIVGREELLFCIREVMEGERRKVIKRNISTWMASAKDATDIGGSSYVNIENFIACLASV